MKAPNVRYEDHSAEFLRRYVEEVAPTVERMGDLALDSIRSFIRRGEEPSAPGEGPTSHPPEFILYESWKRGRVRRSGDLVRVTLYSTARSDDGEVSLALVLEAGTDTVEPRPSIGPGMAAARARLLELARRRNR